MPPDLRDAIMIPLFKKGDRTVCGNYRGISLLSSVGKLFAKIVLGRLGRLAEEVLPETQCGFRPHRGTIDMIFCARQLQEKSREHRRPLHFVFYDLEKAFDSVPRSALWAVLGRCGCPAKFVSIVRGFHDGMVARIQLDGVTSEPFAVTAGVKQGCVLAPTLFSIYLSAMLSTLPPDTPGVDLRCRFDGGLFNISRFRSNRYCHGVSIRELQYADDNACPAESEVDMQRSVNIFSAAYSRFGLKVNAAKTKALSQPVPGEAERQNAFFINGAQIESVDRFTYLGSILSSHGSLDCEIDNRIRSAHAAFGKLSSRVFHRNGLSMRTKLMVYNATVVSALLYACETWTVYRRNLRKLESFHQRKLRSMLGITWLDKVSNEDVLARAGTCRIETTIARHRLRWAGHVARMNAGRLPRVTLFSELAAGKRRQGGPRLRYKDQLKRSMAAAGIDPLTWEQVAATRDGWRAAVRTGTERMDTARTEHNRERRQARRDRAANAPPPTIPCPRCGRMFRARIGLIAHMRSTRCPVDGDFQGG